MSPPANGWSRGCGAAVETHLSIAMSGVLPDLRCSQVPGALVSAFCSDPAASMRGQAQSAQRSAPERVAGSVPPRTADRDENLAEELRTKFARVVGWCMVDLGGFKCG